MQVMKPKLSYWALTQHGGIWKQEGNIENDVLHANASILGFSVWHDSFMITIRIQILSSVFWRN